MTFRMVVSAFAAFAVTRWDHALKWLCLILVVWQTFLWGQLLPIGLILEPATCSGMALQVCSREPPEPLQRSFSTGRDLASFAEGGKWENRTSV